MILIAINKAPFLQEDVYHWFLHLGFVFIENWILKYLGVKRLIIVRSIGSSKIKWHDLYQRN